MESQNQIEGLCLELIKRNFSYQFMEEKNDWKEFDPKGFRQNENCINQEYKIRIGSYNVLFGSPKTSFNFIIRNQTRFNHIVNNTLKKVDPDVVGFCETNQQFIDTLKKSPITREKYFISQDKIIFPKKSHELFMASKLPFITYTLGGSKGAHMGRYLMALFPNFQNVEQSFIVIQEHLFAYEERFQVRQEQMKEVDQFIIQLKKNPQLLEKQDEILQFLKKALENNNIIAQGDLNLHNNIENSYIYKTGFIDTWIEKHGISQKSEEKGYTWDPNQNSMIRLILPYDNRRMRLDRILLRQNSNYFQIEDMFVEGKEKIGFGLVGSDHYFLVGDFKINKEKMQYKQKVQIEESQFQGKGTGFRSINQIIGLRIFSILVFPVFVAGVIYYSANEVIKN